MINISKYEECKAKQLIVLAKLGDAYVVSMKQFDPATGVAISSIVEALDKKDLIAKKEDLIQAAKQIDVLLADIELLK